MHILTKSRPCVLCTRDTTHAYGDVAVCPICKPTWLRMRVAQFDNRPYEPRWAITRRVVYNLLTRQTRRVVAMLLGGARCS